MSDNQRAPGYSGKELISVNGSRSRELRPYYGEHYDANEDPEIDLLALWRIILRYQKLITSVLLTSIVFTFLSTILMRPSFTASSQLELNTSGRNVVKFQQLENDNLRSGIYRQTQLTFLSSRAIAAEVVDRLNLTTEPEYNGRLTQRGLGSLVASIKAMFSSQEGVNPNAKRLAQDIYLSRLSISPIGNSNIINVSISGFEPELAAKIANEHIRAYISLTSDRRFGSSSEAKKFIERELSGVKERLKLSEANLTKFSRENNNVDVDDSDTVILSRLSKLNESVADAQSRRIDAETIFLQASSGNIQNHPAVLADPLAENLKAQLAELNSNYFELSKLYKPKYPAMVELQSKIDEVGDALKRQEQSILESLEATFRQSKVREVQLKNALQGVKNELFELRDKAVEYNILKREWEADRSLFSELLRKSKELEVASGVELNAGSLVELALAPNAPSAPNLKKNLLFGGIFGLMLGLGLALFLNLLDNRINDVKSLEKITQIPTLVVLPKIDEDVSDAIGERSSGVFELRALQAPGDIFCESIDSLRTSLKYSYIGDAERPRVLALTSAVSGEGKSLISTNLAVSHAKAGIRTLLIEVDLRRPRLAKALEAEDFTGLVHAFEDGEPIKIRKFDELEHLNVIFAGAVSKNPVQDLGSEAMDKLLSKCRNEYDMVILDCPPVLGLADTLEIASQVDAILMVVGAHKASDSSVEHAIERLRMVGAPVIGTVFNQANPNLSGYDHYAYGYYTRKAS